MAVALAIFGVAFAAFCVRLTVRIVNRRELWAKWTLAAVVGLPVLYVLSFGPACRMAEREILSTDDIESAYRPVVFIMTDGPQPWQNVIFGYASVCGGHETARIIYLLARIRSVEPEYLGNLL